MTTTSLNGGSGVMGLTGSTCFAIWPHVDTRRFQRELVVLDLSAGEYFALDPLGAKMWTELSAGRSLSEVIDLLEQEYDVGLTRVTEDVFGFAEELVRRGLMRERT